MQVSESWLREWVSPDEGIRTLSEQLTLAGLEVSSIDRAGPELGDECVVVGEILEHTPISETAGLQACRVDIGKQVILDVVCGAPNLRIGMKTACAVQGAWLPSMVVESREIHGVVSKGMLCSASELGLGDDADGIIELDTETPNGQSVREYLNLDECVISFELTPNRGDCLSVAGIAREVSALSNTALNRLAVKTVPPQTGDTLPIQLLAPEDCPRYVGRIVRDIDVNARTPDWMSERLKRAGMRPINPVVDVTNYVMHELGQPMHAFDLEKIRGGIRVRRAHQGESLVLLDDSTVRLDARNLVIADHEGAMALAGIMGGKHSAISGVTRHIYLEAAFFSPSQMLGKARELGMNTDASHRFERGVDHQLQIEAMERATGLVLEICGGQPGPVSQGVEDSRIPAPTPIRFDLSEIARVMGISVAPETACRILEELGMSVDSREKVWRVTPPSWRFDMEGQHDLVEEIGRCVGFDQVSPRMPLAVQEFGKHLENEISVARIRSTMVTLGYHEAITYSFVDPELQQAMFGEDILIRLRNPIASNMSVMRRSLWPGLLEALMTNLNRQESRVRLFEIGQVFRMREDGMQGFAEEQAMAGLVSGKRLPRQWGERGNNVDFFDIKGDVERVLSLTGNRGEISFRKSSHPALQPGQGAGIFQSGERFGTIGRLDAGILKSLDIDQDVYVFELMLQAIAKSGLPEFSAFSRFPSMQRDLAVVVEESVAVDDVLEVVRDSAGGLLRGLELFDIYRGQSLEENTKSLAFSLTFQSESSNLVSAEVDELMLQIIDALGMKLNARLRPGTG